MNPGGGFGNVLVAMFAQFPRQPPMPAQPPAGFTFENLTNAQLEYLTWWVIVIGVALALLLVAILATLLYGVIARRRVASSAHGFEVVQQAPNSPRHSSQPFLR